MLADYVATIEAKTTDDGFGRKLQLLFMLQRFGFPLLHCSNFDQFYCTNLREYGLIVALPVYHHLLAT